MTDATAWYGRLGGGWASVRFKHVVAVVGGQVDPTEERWREAVLYAPNHIESGTGRLLDTESVEDQAAESGKYAVRAGDILYSKIRPALRKVAVAPRDGLCSADMYALRPRSSDLTPTFLFYLLLSDGFYRYSLLESERVAMPKINREALGECPLVLPALDVQRRIADFLDRKTAAIDELIAKKERLVALLAEKRQALMLAALFPDGEGSTDLADLVARGSHPVRPAWSLLRPVKEQGFPHLRLLSVYRDHGVVPKDSRDDNHNRAGEDLGVYQRVLVGDVVMNKMKAWQGSIAVSDHEGIVSPDYQVLRPSGASLRPRFLHSLLRSQPYILEYARRAYGVRPDQWRLMFDEFRSIPIPLPLLEQQDRIVERLDTTLSAEARAAEKVRVQIETLREYRQALITAAVTGQIDVSDELAVAAHDERVESVA